MSSMPSSTKFIFNWITQEPDFLLISRFT
jgi:hypothetical protein